METITLRIDEFGRTGVPFSIEGTLWDGEDCVLVVHEFGKRRRYRATCTGRRTIAGQPADRQPGMGHSRAHNYDLLVSDEAADDVARMIRAVAPCDDEDESGADQRESWEAECAADDGWMAGDF